MDPQSRSIPVLITRPEPQASRFAAEVKDRFGGLVHPILCPLIKPCFLDPQFPDGRFNALVLTSETGARAAGRALGFGQLLPKRAICVGDRTAAVAQDMGFDPVSAGADAEALFLQLLSLRSDAPFLHLRGREARGDLSRRLRDLGIMAEECVVYAQEAQPLSKEAMVVLRGNDPVLIPLFSPRTAELFFENVNDLPLSPQQTIVAMSDAVASNCRGKGAPVIVVADRPDSAAMLNAIAKVIFDA